MDTQCPLHPDNGQSRLDPIIRVGWQQTAASDSRRVVSIRGRASGLAANTVTRIGADGKEVEVAVDGIEECDLLRARPSEKVPTDGLLVEVTDHATADGMDETKLLKFAASLETNSEHPLARALVAHAQGRDLVIPKVESFESTTGGGVSGDVEGSRIAAGKELFLAGRGISFPDQLKSASESMQEEARSVDWIAADGVFGIFPIP